MAISNYLMHGLSVESNISFTDFTALPEGRPEMTIMKSQPSREGLGGSFKGDTLLEGGYAGPHNSNRAFQMYGFPSHYVLSWKYLCDFLVLRDGSRIECIPWIRVPWSDIRQFLLGRVLPLALNLRRIATLHGGAVMLPKGAVAFVADSGTGKSTLISALDSFGHRIVTDDVISLNEEDGGFFVSLGPPQVRLTEKSLDHLMSGPSGPLAIEPDYDKYRVTLRGEAASVGTRRVPLETIYLLNRSESGSGPICISTIPPAKALQTLLRNSTNIALLERPQVREQFSILSRLVGRVPVKLLTFPSRFDAIPEICAAILEEHGQSLDLAASAL